MGYVVLTSLYSPHSLSERAGNDGVVRHVTFHEQCPPNSNSADCPDPVKITLIPRQGEDNVFDLEGGWKGQPAIAEATPSFMEARKWTREDVRDYLVYYSLSAN